MMNTSSNEPNPTSGKRGNPASQSTDDHGAPCGDVRGRSDAARAERRKAIIEAAERVFAEQGLDGATMRAIASEAGCTTGGIYPFFDGKDQLYAEVLQQFIWCMGSALKDALESAAPGREAHAVTRAFFDYYHTRPHELSMGLYLYRNTSERKGLSRTLDRKLNTLVQQALSSFDEAYQKVLGVDDATAAHLRKRCFIYLVGLLILDEAKRLKVLGLNVAEELDAFTDTLLFPYRKVD